MGVNRPKKELNAVFMAHFLFPNSCPIVILGLQLLLFRLFDVNFSIKMDKKSNLKIMALDSH